MIGDGAITGGMAYEAMNNAAYINTRIVVILNGNYIYKYILNILQIYPYLL